MNADGSLDAALQDGMSGVTGDHQGYRTVKAIAVQSEGKILIGGKSVTVNGAARTHLVRLNFDSNLDAGFHPVAITMPTPNSAFHASVHSVFVQEDRRIVIGGSFGLLKGVC